MAEIAVIVVNYGTAELALAAVGSVLARDHGGRSVAVHLVDNASPKGEATLIRSELAARGWQDRVQFLAESENHGFGRGNNLVLHALAKAAEPPRYVFLMNPDATLKTETIDELARFLEAHPDAAVAGAGIDRPETGTPVTAAFRFPSVISEFSSAAKFGPITRLTRRWSVPVSPDAPTQLVDWVSGAALLARFDALRAVDFFDPDFFLYYEETELMHRLKAQDWQVWYCAEARIEHVAGASTGVHNKRRSPMPDYWFDSWRMYFCKTHSRRTAQLAALARLTGSMVHALVYRLRGREPSYAQNFPSDFYRKALRPLFVRSPQ